MHDPDTRTHISERSAAAIIFIIRNEVQTEELLLSLSPLPSKRMWIHFCVYTTYDHAACYLLCVFTVLLLPNLKYEGISLGAVLVLRMIHSVGNGIYCDGHSIM